MIVSGEDVSLCETASPKQIRGIREELCGGASGAQARGGLKHPCF